MDAIKSILNGFDPMALVPDLTAILENLDAALRVVVLAGPLCLLGLGLLYLLAAPREANHIFGYRHFWACPAWKPGSTPRRPPASSGRAWAPC